MPSTALIERSFRWLNIPPRTGKWTFKSLTSSNGKTGTLLFAIGEAEILMAGASDEVAGSDLVQARPLLVGGLVDPGNARAKAAAMTRKMLQDGTIP